MNVVNFMWLVHLNIEEGYLLDKRIFHCIPLCNKHFPVAGVNPHNKVGEIDLQHLRQSDIFPKLEMGVMIIPILANDKSATRESVSVTKY